MTKRGELECSRHRFGADVVLGARPRARLFDGLAREDTEWDRNRERRGELGQRPRDGMGQYVGTYLAWGVNHTGWWGEGEIKFFLDGDKEFPTIYGTGTEDYFCGSYDFEIRGPDGKGHYIEFSTPYSGLAQVLPPDKIYEVGQKFGLYRWHIADPVRFERDLKVTIQALGWRAGGRYLLLQDDIASVAYWYQAEPHAPFPPLPNKDALELN